MKKSVFLSLSMYIIKGVSNINYLQLTAASQPRIPIPTNASIHPNSMQSNTTTTVVARVWVAVFVL